MNHHRLLPLIGALAAVAVPATTAQAAPGDTVFSRDGDIMLRTPAGTERLVTSGASVDDFPAWSPGRTRVAFVRDGDLHVVKADGTGLRRVLTRRGEERYPAWSPDGRRIAFSASPPGGGEAEIYSVRKDGTHLRRLTRTAAHVEDSQPTFTPDGKHVVYTSNRMGFFNFELFRARATDGGRVTRLTHYGTGEDGAPGDDIHPDVSPDGRRIAFVSDRDGGYGVWTMRTDGTDLRLAIRHVESGHVFARWSPDGSQLLYMTLGDAGDHRLWTVPVIPQPTPIDLGRGGPADW